MAITGFNKKLGCTPFPSTSIETRTVNAIATIVPKTAFLSTKVVFGTENIPVGTTIWLPGSCISHNWARDVQELNGVKIIVVPEEMVSFLEKPQRKQEVNQNTTCSSGEHVYVGPIWACGKCGADE